ncbi:APH(3'') family aminoglycoside O-phosphotransferase [Actinomadura sp. ATCC 31491]|uniref:APH(3'') family aminoglycoside O-phosphotransferase n=1 Tax=Actinomadura luzonensis TaxID=2805427 RepID=A0ABT0FU95_9ACTN|nr:APH(3'') family aminoglycoside O-phosphotransferase [Actinomadura luzonensis]MCK2215473.1 APH(3'') family aminoglycoside O-phosphotransferase [Actinomadura luzonensis]
MTACRALLPAGEDWTPVGGGESGAGVFRSGDGSRYAKCVPGGREGELAGERDRVAWLAGQGVPGPRVLGWHVTAGAGACLVTSAVAGVPADRLPAGRLWQAWEAIAGAVRALHDLPARACPFERGLDVMAAEAADVVARGAVNPDFLPEEQRDVPPARLLARLRPEFGRRRRQEAEQAVVCHGDLCLPNIIVDPRTLRVSGFVDLGRLGRADPYADLALLLTNARETWTGQEQARRADEAFAARYGITLDPGRLRFYLHLDPLTWG